MTRLVLASASPRRRALLTAVGRAPDEVAPADVDERALPDEAAVPLVRRLARSKRDAVLATGAEGAVLAADTVVALGPEAIGKPVDEDDARGMLRSLAGEVATVWSGVAVGGCVPTTDVVVGTFLRFHPLSDASIEDYVATGEPMGAAGAFRLQGAGASLVAAVAGCPSNVVGLPLCEASRLLATGGVATGRHDEVGDVTSGHRGADRHAGDAVVSCARCANVTSFAREHGVT